ncbi:MAG: 2Fe-2S iron-sulfur cluster binding domain-containing protein [Rhodospirillaceae bacterium]|nr:2Fe-2S iron-sulfur cluster binding domain-containing protein [Rhodospirillaceae bacterium]
MANVTFTSPRLKKDVTVYAVAGDRGTLLSVARSHHVPIPFDCGDGECGSCLVEIERTEGSKFIGISLTEKEKEMLKQMGKITPEELEDAETNDIPPRYRLACQYFVRDEDIVVAFPGDEGMPEAPPAITRAAPIFKGGLEIRSMDHFLACSVRVEAEAAAHYESLAKSMEACGNAPVAELFAKLAHYSHLHHDEALERAGRRDLSDLMPSDNLWPDFETPEQTTLFAGDPQMARRDALKLALEGERRGYEFYLKVAETVGDEDIRKVAKEFVHEEADHVSALEHWIAGEEVMPAEPHVHEPA